MTASSTKSTERFSDRVQAYVKYRPGYPDALIELLSETIGFSGGDVVADIGSGTGISAELFIRHGMEVYGVEPNIPMREAAEAWLGNSPLFHSLSGTAEATGLPDGSVDLVAAGQAFHWFDPVAAREEFARILKPGGHVLLFWNSRRTAGSGFLEAYESMLLHFGTDYSKINHQNIQDDDIRQFFSPHPVGKHSLENRQVVDFDGLRGRLESSSYVPNAEHPDYRPMIDELRRIFDTWQTNGTVDIEYDVEIYIGTL